MLNGTFIFYCLIALFAIACLQLRTKSLTLANNCNRNQAVKYRRDAKIYLIFAFLILFLPVALRREVGSDYLVYKEAYLKICDNTYNENTIDWLGAPFVYFCKFLSFLIGNNYILFFAIISCLTLIIFFVATLKQSSSPVISVFLYFAFCLYLQSYNQCRQGLAFAICTLAIAYLKEKKVIKYIAFIVCASMIHKSSLILLPLVIVYNKKFTKGIKLLYLIIMFILLFCWDFLLGLLAKTYYGQIYLNWDYYNKSFTLKATLNLIIRVGLALFCFLFYSQIINCDKSNLIYFHMAICCCLLQFCTFRSQTFSRVTTYYFLGYIYLIPEIITKIKAKYKNMHFLVYAFFILYFIIYYFSSSGAIGSGYEIYRSLLF